MTRVKQTAIELIQSLPDECTLEDIQYQLYLCEKVAAGDRAIEEGRTMTQDEAEARIRQWATSFGPTRR
jgi:hypothetical protein